MLKKIRLVGISSLVVIILITTNLNSVSSTDMVDRPGRFCYGRAACASENDDVWPGVCQTGESQSPIDLVDGPAEEEVEVPLRHLKTHHFFIQNNGHTVNVDVIGDNEFGGSYFFPSYGLTERRYRLSNVHFHWGATDEEGSEHKVDGKSYSMEMHLVHYNANYPNIAAAVESGDKDALAVVGIFLNVQSSMPNAALAPVVASIRNISDLHSCWVRVDHELDLTSLMPKAGGKLFSYQGSLTTPGCNEQVNWYVFKDPVSIASCDVKAFRDIKDGGMSPISENHRPVQNLFNRKVLIRTVAGGNLLQTSTDTSATSASSTAYTGGEDENGLGGVTKPTKKSSK